MTLDRRQLLTSTAAAAVLASPAFAAIRLHGGGGTGSPPPTVPVVTPGPGWTGVAGVATTQPPALDTSLQGSGWPYSAVGAFDEMTNIWIEDTTTQVCVGAAINNRAWIKEVRIYCESSTPTVLTTQAVSNRGSQGYLFTPASRPGQNGDAIYIADIVPFNGYILRLQIQFTLNTDPGSPIARQVRYINYNAGNDTTGDGMTAGTAWKTIYKACNTIADGGIIYYEPGQTYVEDTVTGNTRVISRTVDLRPRIAGGTATVTRTPARQDYNGAGQSGVNQVRQMVTLLAIEGLIMDMSKLNGFHVTVGGFNMCFYKRCQFNDPNGIQGPLYSYNANEMTESYAWTCADCTFVCAMGLNGNFMRNCSGFHSWDSMYVFQAYYSIFNYYNYMANLYVQRVHSANTLTITNISYSANNTTLTFAGSPQINTTINGGGFAPDTTASHTYDPQNVLGLSASTTSDGGSGFLIRVRVASTAGMSSTLRVVMRNITGPNDPCLQGNLANGAWTITVVDSTHFDLQSSTYVHPYSGSGGVVFISTYFVSTSGGNVYTFSDTGGAIAAALAIGDTGWVWYPQHCDTFQTSQIQSGSNTLHSYAQRYRSTGRDIQNVLLQTGGKGGTGTTVQSTGTSVTFGVAIARAQEDFLVAAGQARRFAADFNGTTATVVAPFSPDLAPGTNGSQVTKTNKDICFVNCIFDDWYSTGTSSQVQDGTCNVFYVQCTFCSADFSFRNQDAWAVQEAFGAMDCVFRQMDTQSSSAMPTFNVNIDGNYFEAGTVRGTNGGGPGTITYNSTDAFAVAPNGYRPTAGLTKTCRGLNATGVPLVPFNYYNEPRVVGSLVGAT